MRAVSWIRRRLDGRPGPSSVKWRLVTSVMPASAKSRSMWAPLRATRSQGRTIHSPPTSVPPYFGRHPLEPGVNALRLQRRGILRPDQHARRKPVAEAYPRVRGHRAAAKPAGGTQRPSPRSPVHATASRDHSRPLRIALPLDARQVGPDQTPASLRAGADAECPRNLARERGGSQE